MKYVRMTGTPDLDRAPEFYRVLTASPFVTEARLFDFDVSPGGRATGLFEVEGDADRTRAALADSAGVRSVETAPAAGGTFNLLGTFDPSGVPVLEDLFGVVTRPGLVVAKPVVYRDGSVHARVVGDPATLQAAIGEFPAAVDLDVEAIGEFRRRRDGPTAALSDRQREALVAAYDLGYYEHPRAATHADVAERLGCAPNTVSDHLQKAERKVIAGVLASRFER